MRTLWGWISFMFMNMLLFPQKHIFFFVHIYDDGSIFFFSLSISRVKSY